MLDECLFCKIVKGDIPASVVFEDEKSIAFLDIFPVSRGHCLLIPKEHYVNMLDVDLEILAHLSKQLAKLVRKVNATLKPDGVLTAAANGKGAGQEVFHLHFHVIPRNSGDAFGFKFPPGYRDDMAPREELDELAKLIVNTSPDE